MDVRATNDAALLPALTEIEAVLSDPLMQRQFELESEMIDDGANRYWDRVTRARPGTDEEGRFREGEESRTPAAQCILRRALNPVRDGILEFLEAANSGRAGPKHAAVKHLRLLDPETVAFLTLKRCMDVLSLTPDMTNLCIRIGRVVEDEVRMRNWEKQAAHLLARIKENFATGNAAFHRRVLNALASRYEIDLGAEWSKNEALQVGSALLTIVVERTGLFELHNENAGTPNQRMLVRPTQDTIDVIRQCDSTAQFLFPTYMPTVVPPRPWTGPTGGGYHFGLARKLRLVKSRSRGYQQELRNWEMPKVYRAVNALQETPWEVNADVLAYLLPAAQSGAAFAGLPATAIEPIPEAPAGIPREAEDRTPEQTERLKAWKSVARATYESNAERRQQGLVLARTIAVAQKYAKEDRFYFPYTMDFRGRVYPATSFLQPQGCDYQKALLRFADGVPLGDQGACWLAIHGANLMSECPMTGLKIDKQSLQARINWVSENETRILAVAADPDATDWWTMADSPWQFLAFCFEWAGFCREGETFVSHLPVALDGSCNGLQHYSAMLRDEVGGSAVNLIPHDTPADIYMEVCKAALAVLAQDAEGDLTPVVTETVNKKTGEVTTSTRASTAALARRWLTSGQIDRDLCKQPVMTMPYGSKEYGIRDQLMNKIRKRGYVFLDATTGEPTGGWDECGYLAKTIWKALGSVVVKAREAMDWLQKCAKLVAGEGLPITWATPDGFLVLQDYKETFSKRVKTQVAGQLLWPRLQFEDDTTNRLRQQNGIAPNFVHSMDATAMRNCINAGLDAGIVDYAMIHDSYATHAGNTEPFYHLIRQGFIEMYAEEDVLGDFRRNIERQLSDESLEALPVMPKPGTLDLQRVRESDFFFA